MCALLYIRSVNGAGVIDLEDWLLWSAGNQIENRNRGVPYCRRPGATSHSKAPFRSGVDAGCDLVNADG